MDTKEDSRIQLPIIYRSSLYGKLLPPGMLPQNRAVEKALGQRVHRTYRKDRCTKTIVNYMLNPESSTTLMLANELDWMSYMPEIAELVKTHPSIEQPIRAVQGSRKTRRSSWRLHNIYSCRQPPRRTRRVRGIQQHKL